jgi:hypothetical protein
MPTVPVPSSAEVDSDRELLSMHDTHKGLVADLERVTRDVYQSSVNLRETARRLSPSSSVASGYLIFANAYVRFAGAVAQGLRRTSVVERIVEHARAEAEEDRVRREQQSREKQQKPTRRLAPVSVPDTLDDLFGEIEA